MKTNLIIGICLLFGNYSITAQIAPSLTVPKGHKNNVRNCYFTPNDKYLVSTDYEHVLSIWDGDDGRQLFTFQDSTASFSKVEINKSSNLIAALTDSGKLYLFHLSSLKAELLKDSVSDFSMQKNAGTIFLISSGSVYKYIPGRPVLKKLNTTPIINQAKIFALTGNEACVKEKDRDIFILNETTGRQLSIPGSKNLALHDLHAETGFILCSEIKTSPESITYYNIEASSRTIRGRVSIKGKFRDPSCIYTSDHNIFLSTALSTDADEMIITNPPLLYSFKTGKVVREAGEKFVYSIDELQINSSRTAYITEQEPDIYLKIFRQNFPGTASSHVIFFNKVEKPDFFTIACANKSRKVAIFNSEFLLPGIYPSGTVGADGFTNIKKMATHRINFFPDDPKLQEKKAGRKIGFLAEEEVMLNDSVIFARYYSLEKGSEGMLYYLKKSQVTDSFRFSFDYLSNPLNGTTRLFLTRKNRFYELDIARRSLMDSFDLAPHILVRKLIQEGKSILIEREDSLANPKYGSLRYNIREHRITDTVWDKGDELFIPQTELNYSHRIQGYLHQDMVTRDFDYDRNSLFEYPFQAGRVDTMVVLDSAGEISSYQAVQEVPYLRYITGIDKAESDYREIGDKMESLQIGQVRYWDDSCYLVLSTQNKLFLYSAALDSVIRTINCSTNRYSKLFPLANKYMLISNENSNNCYIIDPAKGIIIANIKGFINPSIYQPGGFLILEDAAFGNYSIYRENDFGLIATVTSFSKTDFVVKTASGLFDGTEKAIENLYFLINDTTDKVKPWKTIDLNQLKAKYFIPGLWEKLLSGDSTDLPDVESIKNISLAPEIIADSSWSPAKPYKVTLINKGGGIGAVRVVINGKEVIADARKNPINAAAGKMALSIDLSPYQSYFSGEKNTIQVFSSNMDSSLVSRGGITTSSAKSIAQAGPRLFVISIGTSNYKGDQIDLQYSSKDASDMAAAIQTGARPLFGADSTFVFRLVSDNSDSSMLPTKRNIVRTFRELSKKAEPRDIVLFYLSGHGINAGGDFCYLTADAYTANPSAYIFKEMLQAVAISSKEFTEYFKKITARKQLMIIDACASGKVVENLIAHRDIPYSTLKALDRLKDRTGTHIITGCAADAVSYEASRYGQGLLTYSLLEGIKGASLRENKFLDVVQWFQYARERVPQLADGLGGIQTPQVYSPAGNQSFDIALLDEEAKKNIPLAAARPVYIKSQFQEEDNFADQLRLAGTLDNLLTEKSSQNKKAGFIFFPVDEFPGAYQVFGRYRIQQDTILADIKIFKSGVQDVIASFHLKATDKISLATAIMEKVTDLK